MKKKRKEQMTPAMLQAKVMYLERETEDQCKTNYELQGKNAALKQQLEHVRRELLTSVDKATLWEARFDRLLSVASGHTTDAAKWGAAIENMRTANLGTADRSKRFQLDARTE